MRGLEPPAFSATNWRSNQLSYILHERKQLAKIIELGTASKHSYIEYGLIIVHFLLIRSINKLPSFF